MMGTEHRKHSLTRWGLVASRKRGHKPATAASWPSFFRAAIGLEEIRREQPFGPPQLALAVGVSKQTVHDWLKKSPIPAVLVADVAEALHISPVALLGGMTGRLTKADLLSKSGGGLARAISVDTPEGAAALRVAEPLAKYEPEREVPPGQAPAKKRASQGQGRRLE